MRSNRRSSTARRHWAQVARRVTRTPAAVALIVVVVVSAGAVLAFAAFRMVDPPRRPRPIGTAAGAVPPVEPMPGDTDSATPSASASASMPASTSTSPPAGPDVDPGIDPVFINDPDLKRSGGYQSRTTKPGDHVLPAGTVTVQYDVSNAGSEPLLGALTKVRDALSRASGLAVYLAGGTALNDVDLTTLQTLHKPVGNGGLGLTNLDRLYVYNLRSLQGGRECTPTSGLACAGQTARGGTYPYLWFNGWWDTWVRHLVLDDLEDVKPGTFSNHSFASVSLGSARTIGAMAFGHAPYARLAFVYLPNVTSVGRDAFRRNQYLVKVNLPRAVTVEDYAFDDTSRLEYFAAPALESIGRNALNDTHALRAVHLPNLRYMGINCFDLNGDAAQGTGVQVLRLPKLETLDKNAITGFASLRHIWAPALTTVMHDAITNNGQLQTVYAPAVRTLGPRVFAGSTALRAVYLGPQPPVQDPAAFAGTDAQKLTLYHPRGDGWSGFRPAGNPALRVAVQ
jgi:hypothetical protein